MAAPAQAPAAGCNLDMRAAEDIANRLAHLTGQDPVVLALSAAAVPLGAPIADRLDGSLDLLLARNIAAPDRPDRVVAPAVDTATPRAIIHRAAVSVGLPASWIAGAAAREFQEIERQRRLYRRDRPLMPMSGRIAVVVDMSLSDPYRARAVFDILRDNGATRVIAADRSRSSPPSRSSSPTPTRSLRARSSRSGTTFRTSPSLPAPDLRRIADLLARTGARKPPNGHAGSPLTRP